MRRLRPVIGLFVLGATVILAAPSAQASGWAQFGGRIGAWEHAHTLDNRGCSAGPCYGPRVHSDAQPYEFAQVQTELGRVAAFDLGLPNGTSATVALLQLLTLLPHDTTAGNIYVHHDRFGQTCAYANLQSKTLKSWFGPNRLEGNGTVGVELVTVIGQGTTTYNAGNVDLAIVAPTYLGSDDNC